MRKLVIAWLGLLLSVGDAYAAPLPACAASHPISASKPYGSAALNKLFFHVYDAELWVDDAHRANFNPSDPQARYALHLTYHVDIDAADFLERTLEELERQPNVTPAMKKAFHEQLTLIYPDVSDGQSITAVHDPDKGMILCHQGVVRGGIKDAGMIRAFFAIWLGEHSSEPALRDRLLGVDTP